MLFYILRRLVSAVSVILVTMVATFALFYIAPNDPAGVACGERCTPERYAEIKHSLHLDDPVPQQMFDYFKGLFVGRTYTSGGTTVDCTAPCLGYSYRLGQPVTKLLAQAVPVTLSIVIGGAVVYLTLGVLAGVTASQRRGSLVDRGLVATSLVVGSIPYFIVALVISLYATFLPPSTYVSLLSDPLAWATGLIAAWFTLGVANTAGYTRYSRASMIESMGEDYIRSARAKGLTERRVVYRHGLRAAMTPVATIFGLDLAGQMAGAIFTERIFGLPGLGVLTLNAFGNFDLPVLMGSVLVGATVLVLMNLLVDLLYAVLDPRVRLS